MFGDNLKKYRIQNGYSQSELADKLFVSRQCVSKWEKGIT
ncbi:MAG: helix-turn-helix domain-containing protein [Clostridiales bacterium]|nr:helix-turn-helix domain-containing protein [Clostridiales bacterium]